MTHKRIAQFVAVATAATAIALGGAGFASADGNVCESGEFCLYENTNFNDGSFSTYGKHQWGGSDSSYSNNKWWDYKVPGHHNVDVLNDEASSLWNRTGCRVAISQHENGGGDTSNYANGSKDTTFENNNVGDNRASSHKKVC
jgi:Peptidase inhibitor family I36